MNSLNLTPHGMRRARTKSLIQIGALVDKSGLLETFSLPVGSDFQKDAALKNEVGAFYKGLLILNEMVTSGEAHIPLWSHQGLTALAQDKKQKK
jgi:hypothetical protein